MNDTYLNSYLSMYFWMGFLQYRLVCRSEIGQKIRTMARLSIYLYVHEGKIAYWPQYRIAPSYYYTYWLNVSLDLRILIKTFHNEAKTLLMFHQLIFCFSFFAIWSKWPENIKRIFNTIPAIHWFHYEEFLLNFDDLMKNYQVVVKNAFNEILPFDF